MVQPIQRGHGAGSGRGDRLVRAVRRHIIFCSHESIRARVLFLSARARISMAIAYSILGCGIGVNRLKRGGGLFEGIVQRQVEEYIIRTRCARSGLSSSEEIPNRLLKKYVGTAARRDRRDE